MYGSRVSSKILWNIFLRKLPITSGNIELAKIEYSSRLKKQKYLLLNFLLQLKDSNRIQFLQYRCLCNNSNSLTKMGFY